jgi:hypothetical protein
MVPDELRGRVMSLYSLMFMGVMPFASLMVTSLVDWIGMRRELQIAAVVYGLGACLLLGRLRRTWQEPGAAEPRVREPARPSLATADD